MRVEQEQVRLFLERHGRPSHDRPTLVPITEAEHRRDLIAEELEEYLRAVHAGDLVAVADALADLAYVVLGTAATHGIELQPIFAEVHRSNMTKTPLDPVTKKGGKGEGYEPPQIAALLFVQSTGLHENIHPLVPRDA